MHGWLSIFLKGDETFTAQETDIESERQWLGTKPHRKMRFSPKLVSLYINTIDYSGEENFLNVKSLRFLILKSDKASLSSDSIIYYMSEFCKFLNLP
jgi:hypothetical protein